MAAAFRRASLSIVFLSLGILVGCSRVSSTAAAAPLPQSPAATTQYTYETVMAVPCASFSYTPDLCVLGKFGGSFSSPQFARDVLNSLSSQGWEVFSVTPLSGGGQQTVELNPCTLSNGSNPSNFPCFVTSGTIIYTLRQPER